MKVTRRQLRNLINEVLNEQTPLAIEHTKENDKQLFLYMNQVGKTATPKWTFSLGSTSSTFGVDDKIHGEIHFIDTKEPRARPGHITSTPKRSRRYWEELRSVASDALDVFNKKHGTTYYTSNAYEGSRFAPSKSGYKFLVLAQVAGDEIRGTSGNW